MKPDNDKEAVELNIRRPYNKKELRFLFGNISLYYLNRMIDNAPDVGEPLGIGFSPRQVLILIRHYGLEKTFAQNQSKIY